jgi:Arc/MetJ-type ribon-helix-helix transcriptional regulator
MIPPDQWQDVNLLAKKDQTSNSGVVRTALREYIDKRTAQARAEKKKRAALAKL